MNKNKLIGIVLTLLGAIFWGSSSTAAQYLELNQHINVGWLVSVRIIIAGLISVSYIIATHKKQAFSIFKNWKDTINLIIFGLFGISLAQYAYFKAIIYSDAGIATVMCYLAPILIILYVTFFIAHYPQSPK